MPAKQAGSFYRVSGGWGVRWYEDGRRRFRSGFESKSAARDYFANVVRPRLDGIPAAPEPLTLSEFSERFLTRYEAIRSPVSAQTLRWRLVRPLDEFGDTELGELRVGEIAAWEATLPPRFRHAVMRAFRQLCAAAVEWGYLAANPAKTGANPQPGVIEREILSPAEVDALADEMEPLYGAAVVVGAWCFLRPSELVGLERRDAGDGLLNVRGTKTARSRRSVPVPRRAREALEALPARLDTRLLFPGPAGGVYDLRNFRRREFEWAVDAAGLPDSVTPYTLRHSGISWALASGIPAVDVARYGGTSVTMLERHYHHLLVSSAESARARMDEFMATTEAAEADSEEGPRANQSR
jgi:integrase